MKTLLRIDASARRTDNGKPSYNSISKSLAQLFCDHWQAQNNLSEFIYRDLGDQAPPAITQDWIAAVFTPEEHQSTEQQRLLALSDCLIDELQRADIILISTPMYNYGMPAALKAWFDQVIRINRTFSFDLKRGDFPLRPILSGKKLVLVYSCGEFGFGEEGIRAGMNHLGPHIKTLSHYLGVEQFYEVRSEYQEFADERHQASVAAARDSLTELAQML
ncbi:NAD(P)H-dependent oxidoreductase [Shewanella algae]|uniref:FMN-dependent NADH-azoreductase n=1 Tax=Shewanella algae TaxID=38313 RepID=UPI001AADD4E7|nr:NAD(P)H-dependent oxidoreductase [Shewanella algae]MBO2571407.1 NAD(P)H-dependent oxidoreductase [Shewanella algae]